MLPLFFLFYCIFFEFHICIDISISVYFISSNNFYVCVCVCVCVFVCVCMYVCLVLVFRKYTGQVGPIYCSALIQTFHRHLLNKTSSPHLPFISLSVSLFLSQMHRTDIQTLSTPADHKRDHRLPQRGMEHVTADRLQRPAHLSCSAPQRNHPRGWRQLWR